MKETLLKDAKQNLILMLPAAFVGLYSPGQANAEPSVKFNTVNNPNALHYAFSEMLMHNSNTDVMDTLSYLCPKNTTNATLWARLIFRKYTKQTNIKRAPNYTLLTPPIKELVPQVPIYDGGLQGNHTTSSFTLDPEVLSKKKAMVIVQCFDAKNRALIPYEGINPVLAKDRWEVLKNLSMRVLNDLTFFGSNNQREIIERYPKQKELYGRMYVYVNRMGTKFPSSKIAISFGNLDENFVKRLSAIGAEKAKIYPDEIQGRLWFHQDENSQANPNNYERLSHAFTQRRYFPIYELGLMINGEYNNGSQRPLSRSSVRIFNGWKKKEKIPTPKPRPKNLKRSSLESQKTEKEVVSVEPVSAGAQVKSD